MRLLTILILAGHALLAAVLLLVAVRLWPPCLGIDLGGGMRLVYAVGRDPSLTDAASVISPSATDLSQLVPALKSRIDPGRRKELRVQLCDEQQVEVIIPEMDVEEVDNVKRQISTVGLLQFRIVANARDHQDVIAVARKQAQDPAPTRRISRIVTRRDVVDDVAIDERVGFWVQAAKTKLKALELEGQTLRNAATGEMVDLQSLGPVRDSDQLLDDYLSANGLENVDMLVVTNDGCDVTGNDLGMVASAVDEYLSPCVTFRLHGEGVRKFQFLTSANLPDTDSTPPFYRHLGIILDEQLISFPRLITTISDSGRITGSFTQEEVDFLVGILRAGTLPVPLEKIPVSEYRVDPDGAMRQRAAAVVSVALGILVIVWLMIILRFGLVGLGGVLASVLQVLSTLVAVELTRMPVTMPAVIVIAALSLLNALGIVLVCMSLARARRNAETAPKLTTRSMTRCVVSYAVALGVLWLGGIVLGPIPVHSVVVLGSTVAFVTLCTCMLVPWALRGQEPAWD